MRCDDLTRELACPTGALPLAEVAGHLAACPACAERSRLAGRFDRIWEATRPAGPSMDAMDALWARASRELDALEAPATLRLVGPARRRRRAVVALFLAQAAAILLAAVALLARDGKEAKAAVLDVPVGFDQMAVVSIDGEAKGKAPVLKLQDLSPLFSSPLLPDHTPHDEVGEMEAMASSLEVADSQ